ncbi:Hypothetical protein R9X50_00366200 [Acrodontium crateriforme]|uniref:2-dehydropantoate 2-reductase n=1 Tax=Acrodontium crateriforme TaxID=150365 RepID=A0AAQ3M4K3_9PEZI|nr:Hypothetical protein R9X50_00366200 [Acrodontium crateriforme]
MTKALIFGTGGVGCIYSYILHKAGVEVTTICRTNYDVVKSRGILVRSKIFGRQEFKPHAVRDVAEAHRHGPYDYILVCSKAFPGTAEKIKEAVTSTSAIVLAQNGIGIEEEYAKLFPNNTIISGVVYLPVTQVEPGVVEHGPLEMFKIGTYPSTASQEAKAKAELLAQLFDAGGGTCCHEDDVQSRRWLKVSVNASWNPICALTQCDDANFLRSSKNAEEMIRKIMREVGQVASAAGYPNAVTEETIENDLKRPIGRLETGGKEPSMLTDVRNERPLEVEAIVGNTLRIGQKYGVVTPYLELIYMLAQGRNYSIAPDNSWKPIARHG